MDTNIGIDISKASFDITILQEDEKLFQGKYSNDTKGFDLFEQKIRDFKTENLVLIMEASGAYYYKLAYFLFEKGYQVSVVNPLVIRRFCQMRMVRAKTDKKDAEMIARYGKTEKPALWKPSKELIIKLKQKNTVLEQLLKQSTSLSNQIEAFVQSQVQDQESLQVLKKMKLFVAEQIKSLEEQAAKIINLHFKETFMSLTSIPGIGKKTAIMLIAITDNFTKFDSSRKLISFIGTSPRIFESGTSVKGKGRITKMGMGQIRKLIYMCAWSAKRCNVYCMQMYERLKAKGKPEKVIKIAIANKLLKQAFAVVENKTVFNNNL